MLPFFQRKHRPRSEMVAPRIACRDASVISLLFVVVTTAMTASHAMARFNLASRAWADVVRCIRHRSRCARRTDMQLNTKFGTAAAVYERARACVLALARQSADVHSRRDGVATLTMSINRDRGRTLTTADCSTRN